MNPLDEVQISKLCDTLVQFSSYLQKQSEGLSGTALYLDKLSNDMANSAKSIKNILQPQQDLLDLPLELL